MNLSPQSSSPRAFTLIELLTVISIIAVVAALAYPIMGRMRETSNRATCISNVRQLGAAMKTYAGENDQVFPYTQTPDYKDTWENLLLKKAYITKKVLVCPSDLTKRNVSGDIRSYAVNGYVADYYTTDTANSIKGVGMQLTKPLSDVILVADRGSSVSVINSVSCANAFSNNDCWGNHKKAGANYVFLDLHAEWLADSGNYGQTNPQAQALWNRYWPCK